MARTLATNTLTEIGSTSTKLALFFRFDFPATGSESDGTIRIWTGLGDKLVTEDGVGRTYIGVGDALGFTAVDETPDLGANSVSVTLSGIKDSLLEKARDTDYQGEQAFIYLGFFNSANDAFIEKVQLFRGFMDTMDINVGPETSTILLTIQNALVKLQRKQERRYTDEDQKADYPADKGFEFVAELSNKSILWGRTSSVPTGLYAAQQGK